MAPNGVKKCVNFFRRDWQGHHVRFLIFTFVAFFARTHLFCLFGFLVFFWPFACCCICNLSDPEQRTVIVFVAFWNLICQFFFMICKVLQNLLLQSSIGFCARTECSKIAQGCCPIVRSHPEKTAFYRKNCRDLVRLKNMLHVFWVIPPMWHTVSRLMKYAVPSGRGPRTGPR